jgi:hypothetical protein
MTAKYSAVIAVMLVALMLAGAGGCTRAKAKTAPDAPELAMPAPPPRDVDVTETEPPPPMPLQQEPARNAPQRPRPQAQQQPARPNESPKPEPQKIEPSPAPTESPKPPEEPAKPPPATLQTTPAQADLEVERAIRTTMSKASADLNRIDYRVLNNDGRTQYEQAKRFVLQADEALGRKNLEYARTLAEKAAALAAQLRGR